MPYIIDSKAKKSVAVKNVQKKSAIAENLVTNCC